jgi:NAD(P)-dependent dehydrogenase (short-subunit alcohol dehydrogenase family)
MTGSPTDRGPVVVTGTSTGIGAAITLRLADAGFSVFAGVRRADDGTALQSRAKGRVTPLILDITDSGMIASALETVTAALDGRGLAGLVNNAGIVKPGPLEFIPIPDFRDQLEVNLFGHLAVTQAFLPLIREGNGRLVNIGSVGGRLVLPLHGGYSASKFAMEAVTDAFRLELRQWNIHVSIVDPGGTASAIFDKTIANLEASRANLHDRGIDLYDAQIDAVRALVEKTAHDTLPADRVAKVVFDALTAKRPKTRYLAGKGAKPIAAIAATLPDHLKDIVVAREADLPAPES